MRPLWALRKFAKRLILLLHLGTVIEYCKRCGAEQPIVWWCESDALWFEITGSKGNVYCPKCFDHLAAERGIGTRWNVSEDFRASPSAERPAPTEHGTFRAGRIGEKPWAGWDDGVAERPSQQGEKEE